MRLYFLVLLIVLPLFANEKVDKLLSQKKYKQVIRYIDRKLKNDRDEEIIYNYAFAQEQLGNFKKSIEAYNAVYKTCPDNGLVLSSLARVHCKINQYEKAYKYSLDCVREDDSITESFIIQHGVISFKYGKYDEAQMIFERYNNVKEASILGSIYFEKQLYKKALPYLFKQIEERPEDNTVATHIAYCYLNLNQMDSSIAFLVEDSLYKKTRLKETEKIALQIHKKFPTNVKLIMFLGQLNIELGEYADALEFYKLASYNDTTDAKIACKRGDVHLLLNDLKRAKQFYDKALKIDNSYALAYCGLAKVFRKKGNLKEHTRMILQAAELDKTNIIITEELKRIR